jgi:hypothetical protein
MHTKFCFERLKGRDASEDLGVNGRITLIWILKICREDGNSIYVAQNRDQCLAPVNTNNEPSGSTTGKECLD